MKDLAKIRAAFETAIRPGDSRGSYKAQEDPRNRAMLVFYHLGEDRTKVASVSEKTRSWCLLEEDGSPRDNFLRRADGTLAKKPEFEEWAGPVFGSGWQETLGQTLAKSLSRRDVSYMNRILDSKAFKRPSGQ